MRVAASLIAVSLLAGAAGLSACDAGETTTGPGGTGAGDVSAGPGSSSVTSGAGGGFISTGNGGGPTAGCSADLHYVVDGEGNVIMECPPDQGCSGGMCVPACQAAGDSKGNVGCDFTVATPYFFAGASFFAAIPPPCFAVFVANNWGQDVVISVSRGGMSYDVGQFGRIATSDPNTANWAPVPATGLPPGEVAVLFLSQDPLSANGGFPLTCPVPPAISQAGGSAVADTGRGTAWKITTDTPVSAYDILPYGGASSFLPSAELLLPTTAWGTNYIAILPTPPLLSPTDTGPRWGQIVASEDDTTVQVLPNITLPAGPNVMGAPANATTSFTLNAGEYIQWELPQDGSDLTGTIIQSDKPLAYNGGDAYICYSSATSFGGGCDSAHQQIPPIAALGAQYVAPPFATRGSVPESIFYRFVGAVDGTTLTYDPAVPGAPTTLSAGQAVDFETTLAFVVSSQGNDNPFYVGQVMSGNGVTGNASGDGDEEFVNILPPAQWLSKYVFFTDPTYPTTNLVLVRENPGDGFADVSIDCLGTVQGWTDIGAGGTYQITNVDLIRGGVQNGACTNGPHVAESVKRFGLMVWGLASYSSYAYPAGGNVAPINTVVIPPVPR